MENSVVSGREGRFSPATSLTLKYVTFGMLWILFSDSMLSWVARDSMLWQISHIHILKGVFFIGLTGAFLFYFVQSLHQRLVIKDRDMGQLFSGNPHSLLIVDPSTGKILQINEAARFLLGYKKEELISKPLADVVVAESQERFVAEMKLRQLAMSFHSMGSWSLKTKAGKDLVVQFDVVHLSGGGKSRLMVALQNLTELIRTQRELRETTQYIEQKISQRTTHLVRQNEDLAFRAKETEKVNAELIFINQRLQEITRGKSVEAKS